QVYPLDISLENLKDRLGIPADKYKDKNGKDRIDHFEERVLKPAKAALDESCPYTFNYVKVRENPNNKRSKVTGFRFYPVYQPQFRDEELEGKELQAKVTARYQIDSHVYEYLRYSCGFTSEEINRNKETFITAQEKITDLIGELALLNGKSREKNNPKGWIINALKGKIKDK
ncbi:replication initiation protein, partial [Bacteroides fragilis]